MANNSIETGIRVNFESDTQDLEEAQQGLEQLSQQAEQSQESLSNLGENAQEAGQNLAEIGAEAERGEGIFSRLKSSVLSLGAAFASLFAIKNFSSMLSSSTALASDFENQMRRIQAVMGLTGEEAEKSLGAIEAEAKKLGASTRFTASEAAAGFEVLARAGLSTAEQLSAMNKVLATAQGNSISIAEAADLVISAYSGMQMSVSEAGRVADVMSKAAQSANLSINDLGEGLKFIAPSAAAAGMSLEELSAWLSTLNQNGLKAGMAGTSLANVFAQFQNPASQFRAELSAIGINTNNFAEAMEQLSKTSQDTTKAFNAAGVEGARALGILASENGIAKFRELQTALENSAGAAEQAAKTMDSSLQGAVAGLGSAWESLKLELGKPLLEPLREKVSGLSQSIRELTAGGGITAFGNGLKSVFEVISSGIGLLVKYCAQILAIGGAYATVRVSLMAYTAAHNAYSNASNLATAATNKFKAALASIKTLGATAIISGLVIAYQNLKSSASEVAKTQLEASNAFAKTRAELEELRKITERATEANQIRAEGIKQLSTAEQERLKEDQERANSIKTNIEAEIQAQERLIETYKKQQEAANEKWKFDKEAWDLASQAIVVAQRNIEQLEKTKNAQIAQEQQEKKILEAQKKTSEELEKSKKGWEALTVGISDNGRALLEIPEKSQKIIEALADISANSKESGANLARAFALGAGEVETVEALARVRAMLNQLRADNRLTADEYAKTWEILEAQSQRLPPQVNNATLALAKLGLTAQEVQTGINQQAEETIRYFSLASENYQKNAEQLATVYNASLAKMENPQQIEALNQKLLEVVGRNEEFRQSVLRAAEAQREAKSKTDEQKNALEALGISIEAVNQKMSKTGLEMANNLRFGLEALRKGATNAQGFQMAVQELAETAINSAKTAEDFKAIKEALAETGAYSKLSAEQMKVFEEGMRGGAKAVNELKASLNALKTAQNTGLNAVAEQAEEVAEATEKVAENTEEATKEQKKLSEETKKTARAVRQVAETSLSDIGADEVSSSFKNANQEIEKTAENAKRAEENFKNLSASARDTADSIAQNLASLRGQEETVLEMQNSQKLRQLQEKLNEAKERGNQEEVSQYQRAIRLQRELFAEQQKQLEEKQKTKNSEQLAVSNSNQKPLTSNSSLLTAHSSLTADDVANAFSAQIEQAKKEAMEQGAKLGREQLAKELIKAAKGRAR